MRKVNLTPARQQRFIKALSKTGNVTKAAALARASRTRIYERRRVDPVFAAAWEDAEEVAADRLEDEARRRAVEGVPEPLVSAGKLVRDDDGQPIIIRRYSDNLLLALIKARRPPPRQRSVHIQFPALRSIADATDAMGAISNAVASGAITPGEAAELSRFVEAYIKAIDAGGIVQRLLALEAKLK
jgi:hypothetical protein